MMDDDERNRRIDELLDRQALSELVNAYCNAADRHDHAKMRELYHDDAIDDHGPFSRGPASEFLDKLPQIQAAMAILHHNVTTMNFKLDGDRAEGEIYLIAFHQVRDGERLHDVLIGGRYFDRYQKRDGVWKFSYRSVVADWVYAADPSSVRLDHPMLQGAYIGRPGPEDPSYGFFRMLRRGER